MTETATPAELGFDPDALREKYREERDKRVRADGNAQYTEVTGRYAHYLAEPNVAWIEREAKTDTVEVTIIGGGFAGLLIGARLREAGVEDIRMIDKASDFGGTWYWNRYPGAACDTEAYIYMPLLEETGYMPTEKYAKGPEIFEHSRRIARHFDLYRDALLQTAVIDLKWDEPSTTLDESLLTTATNFVRGLSAWRMARSTGRNCRVSKASRASRGIRFTRAAGTTPTPAVIATEISKV